MLLFAGWIGALAAETEGWVGGHVTTGLQVDQDQGVGTILSQVELDARAETSGVYFRLDLDYHFDPLFFSADNSEYQLGPHYPLPPEVALVQFGDKYHLRAGVVNPNFGLQGWDEKETYLPTYTYSFALTNGQILGIEPGITFDDGTGLFVFGGYDMGFQVPDVGFGVSTEQDAFGTWSGVFWLPTEDYVLLLSANEVYPADWLWLTLEIDAGLASGGGIAGGELVASLWPESIVGGALRVERQMTDTKAQAALTALEIPMAPLTALSAGLRIDPASALHLALEAKETLPDDGAANFTGTFLVTVMAPGEPGDDFAVHDAEDPAEE
ncbi:MAG: hypothetical protein ABMB14_04380 [Myxococcota bacterium]